MAPRTCSSPMRSWVGCPSSSMAVASLGLLCSPLGAWCLVPGSRWLRFPPVGSGGPSLSAPLRLSRHCPLLDPVDEQAGAHPGRTLGQVVLGLVGAGRPGDVDVDPGHVPDELLEEQCGKDGSAP